MSLAAPGLGGLDRVKTTLLVFVALVGTVCGLTLLFLSMRSIMEIGGACAEGGPFVPVRPCPDGVPALLLGGLWGGVACFGVYVWQTWRNKVPSFAGLAWPALFLSLGWNFLEFGLDPPGGGLAWGWLVCAFLFALMGGVPLLVVAGPLLRAFTGRGPGDDPLAGRPLAAVRRAGSVVGRPKG